MGARWLLAAAALFAAARADDDEYTEDEVGMFLYLLILLAAGIVVVSRGVERKWFRSFAWQRCRGGASSTRVEATATLRGRRDARRLRRGENSLARDSVAARDVSFAAQVMYSWMGYTLYQGLKDGKKEN